MSLSEGSSAASRGCPAHYEGFESAPSTRQLSRMIKEDPAGSVPVWDEVDLNDIPTSWPEDDPEAENRLLALRSEMHALMGLVVNDFTHELGDFRKANEPFGLLKPALSPGAMEASDTEPTLEWVSNAIAGSTFHYSGEYLSALREPDHPYSPAIARLDEIIEATTRHPEVHPTSTRVERDELQVFINSGVRTSTGVSKVFLEQIERIVRSEVENPDPTIIADTAHRSYRLPLQLARLSLGTVLTYGQLIKETRPLVLVEEEDGYRVAFSAPPNELFKSILGRDLEHPTMLGCPANVKIGKRMIDELWHWFIDVAKQANVWENKLAPEMVG